MLGIRLSSLLGIVGGIAFGAYLTSPLVAALSDGVQADDLLVAEQVQVSLISAAFYLVSLMVVLTGGTFVIVYVHELGHLLVGSAFGFEPLYFMAGPILIDLGGERIRLRTNPMRRYVGGAVAFIAPAVTAGRLAQRWFWMAAAGPIANIAFGLLVVSLAGVEPLGESLPGWVAGIGLLSATMGILNLMPLKRFGISDGMHLWVLARGGERAARLLRQVQFGRWVMSPTRPAAWPDDVVAAAEATAATWPLFRPIGDADDRFGAAQILVYRYADRGEFGRLEELLARITAAPRSPYQRRFATLALFDVLFALQLAAWSGQPRHARAILESVPAKATIRVNSVWHAAWAAVHLAEGSRQRAAEEAQRALKLLERFGLRSGADQAEHGWVKTILDEATSPRRHRNGGDAAAVASSN